LGDIAMVVVRATFCYYLTTTTDAAKPPSIRTKKQQQNGVVQILFFPFQIKSNSFCHTQLYHVKQHQQPTNVHRIPTKQIGLSTMSQHSMNINTLCSTTARHIRNLIYNWVSSVWSTWSTDYNKWMN